jgi:hypothetical protein
MASQIGMQTETCMQDKLMERGQGGQGNLSQGKEVTTDIDLKDKQNINRERE